MNKTTKYSSYQCSKLTWVSANQAEDDGLLYDDLFTAICHFSLIKQQPCIWHYTFKLNIQYNCSTTGHQGQWTHVSGGVHKNSVKLTIMCNCTCHHQLRKNVEQHRIVGHAVHSLFCTSGVQLHHLPEEQSSSTRTVNVVLGHCYREPVRVKVWKPATHSTSTTEIFSACSSRN